MKAIAATLVVLAGAARALAADDVVTIAASTGSGRMRLGGQVIDYTGEQLTLRLAGGREQSFRADQVLDVETAMGPRHQEADQAVAQRRFDEAEKLLRTAFDEESRPWVRRMILAKLARCCAALDQWQRAGEAFLMLVQSDPATPYFDAVPLAWLPRQSSAALEQVARRWMEQNEPAAALLGASHLLVGTARAAATERLRHLATAGDRRIALLATAQLWRAETITADEAKTDAWQRTIDAMPEPLQAGPYFVLGSALSRQKRWEEAALALLRVPILYPEQRPLAARALLEAGGALENLGQPKDTARLYAELVRAYPDQAHAVAEAEARLRGMGGRE